MARGSNTRKVAVVGAGIVGLSTAWFLQTEALEVTVFDRVGVAAGASRGNAGWLTPGLATPLPEPGLLRYGVRAALRRGSPVYVSPAAAVGHAPFLAGLLRHSTSARWARAMGSLVPLNVRALEAYDDLADGGVEAPTWQARSFLAAFRTAVDRAALLEEIMHIRSVGQRLDVDVLSGAEARGIEPMLSGAITAAISLHGQRFTSPGDYVASLAASVRARGGHIVDRAEVRELTSTAAGPQLVLGDGRRHSTDVVVLAAGAALSPLARGLGVTRAVKGGRGYSFTISTEAPLVGPVYFPTQRVACTPLGSAMRVAGMMEFRSPGTPLDPRRIAAIVAAVRPLVQGADLEDLRDEWVGSRPCTVDGLPIVGATRTPDVYVAGGHGMWGMTLGPITGKLLARAIARGEVPAELVPFDPLR